MQSGLILTLKDNSLKLRRILIPDDKGIDN